MKTIFKLYSIILFINFGLSQKTTVAVFEFENNGLDKSAVRIITERMQSEFVKAGGYKVVERSKIDNILKEQKFQNSGCVDECLIEIGKMVGAKEALIGSVGKLGNLFTITARLVDVSTGCNIFRPLKIPAIILINRLLYNQYLFDKIHQSNLLFQ